jgi:hypothetical protein
VAIDSGSGTDGSVTAVADDTETVAVQWQMAVWLRWQQRGSGSGSDSGSVADG